MTEVLQYVKSLYDTRKIDFRMYAEVTYFLQCIQELENIPTPQVWSDAFIVSLKWFKAYESLTINFVNMHTAYLTYTKDNNIVKTLDLPYISQPPEDLLNLLRAFLV